MEKEDDPCTVPRDGDNPLIWSTQIPTGPFSLLIGQPLDPNCFPPTYLSLQVLNRIRPADKISQFQGYVEYQQGGLLCQDQRVLQNQSGVILQVIKQVAAVLMKGQGLVGLSLPIRLFQPRSTLQRMLDRWALMPFYFQDILNFDPITRLKKVIAMSVAGLAVAPSQQKPFNPLLGETLQAFWPDGTKAYCEHTCHHPPITNFYVIGKGFTMTGHLELTGKFKKNSLIGGILGTVNINFEDGSKISYSYPEFRAGGMLMGARTVNWQGTMIFRDSQNEIEAELVFGPVRKKSMFRRAIGKLDDIKGEIRQAGSKVGDVVGSWLRNLVIDGEEIWNIESHIPVFHSFPVNPLPSDWRYREDLVYLMRGNQEAAQRWKHRIENRQREDRKLKGLKY